MDEKFPPDKYNNIFSHSLHFHQPKSFSFLVERVIVPVN